MISVVSRISSLLSIFGSMAIVYMIMSDHKRKLARPKNRLMLMMSFFDILSSTAFGIADLAMPSESGIGNAMGNSATCVAQGIFIWLGLAVPMYNTSLNLFYMLTIKYSVNPNYFSKKIEPFLHLISILVPLSIAIVFAVNGEIEPRGNVCIGTSRRTAWVMLSISSFCLLFCVFSMVSICWAVKQRANKMRSHRFRASLTNNSRILEEDETVKQALLYTSAFILTFIFPLVQSVSVTVIGPSARCVVFVVLTGILYPLQGFWNFALYIRPGVNKIKAGDPNRSLIEAICEVVFNVQSPTTTMLKGNVSYDGVSIAVNANDSLPQTPSTLEEEGDCNTIVVDDRRLNRRQSFVQLASVLDEISFGDLSEDDIESNIIIDDHPNNRRRSFVQMKSISSEITLNADLSEDDKSNMESDRHPRNIEQSFVQVESISSQLSLDDLSVDHIEAP